MTFPLQHLLAACDLIERELVGGKLAPGNSWMVLRIRNDRRLALHEINVDDVPYCASIPYVATRKAVQPVDHVIRYTDQLSWQP